MLNDILKFLMMYPALVIIGFIIKILFYVWIIASVSKIKREISEIHEKLDDEKPQKIEPSKKEFKLY